MILAKVKISGEENLDQNIRFRIVQALTRSARDATLAIKEDVPRRFTLRRDWVIRGIRMEAATIRIPIARVYSIDSWMLKQEEGQLYRPADGHVAIPAGVRSSENSAIPRSLFPKQVMRRRDTFAASFEGKRAFRGLQGIFQRTGSGLKILYLLKREKRTQDRWDFGDTVAKTVDDKFETNFR